MEKVPSAKIAIFVRKTLIFRHFWRIGRPCPRKPPTTPDAGVATPSRTIYPAAKDVVYVAMLAFDYRRGFTRSSLNCEPTFLLGFEYGTLGASAMQDVG